MRKFSLALPLRGLTAATPLLAACQTTAGVGQNPSNEGRSLTSGAERSAPSGGLGPDK
jgi:predicted small secreted protein